MTISKNLHFFWWQGWDKLPAKYVSRVQSVIDHNPGWTVYKWDAQNVREVIKSIGDEYLQKLDSFELLHQSVDFSRYCCVYALGGASIDCDAIAYRGFESLPFIETSNLIISKNSSNEIENLVKAGIPEVLMNATILASPQNPVLKKLIDHILGLSCDVGQNNYSCIQGTTGPNAFTKYILDNFKDQITIVDNVYMDPCNGNDESCTIDPSRTVLDQNQEGSWANPNYKKIARAWYFIKRRWMSVVIVLAIIIILIILLSKK